MESSFPIENKSILIVGAGIGGVCTAISVYRLSDELNVKPPKIIILEKDKSIDDKFHENYSISLRKRVMENFGYYEEFQQFSTPSHYFFLAFNNFTHLTYLLKYSGGGYRIRRNEFRIELIKKLPEGIIKWNTTVTEITQFESDGRNKVKVKLSDDSILEVDLLIAADGTRSVVRSLVLPEEKSTFAGVVLLAGTYQRKEEDQKIAFDGHGSIMSKSGVGFFIAPENENEIIWALSYLSNTPREPQRGSKTLAKGRENSQEDEKLLPIIDEILERGGKDFPEPIPRMIKATSPATLRVLSCYDKMPHHCVGNIVFIGDSTHPLTPFSGAGANQAICDAVSLAKQLFNKKNKTLQSAIEVFDKEMITRTTSFVLQGRETIRMLHEKSLFKIFFRNTIIRIAHFVVNHPKKFVTLISSIVIVGIGLVVKKCFLK